MKINWNRFEYRESSMAIWWVYGLAQRRDLNIPTDFKKRIIELMNNKKNTEQDLVDFFKLIFNFDLKSSVINIQFFLPNPKNLTFEDFLVNYQEKEMRSNVDDFLNRFNIRSVFTDLQIRDFSAIYVRYYQTSYMLPDNDEQHYVNFSKGLGEYLTIMKNEPNKEEMALAFMKIRDEIDPNWFQELRLSILNRNKS